MSVPPRMSHGIMCRKVRWRVCSRTSAPLTPPSRLTMAMVGSRSLCRSRRSVASEVSCPGHSASVLVALACTGGTPMPSIAGKEMKEPPPAMAFITPAMSDATTSQM
jgi:hypothetical protein